MSLDYVNPMENLYKNFITILRSVVVKYQKEAEIYETPEMSLKADEYIDAYRQIDTFDTYSDYTEDEIMSAGIYDYKQIQECEKDAHNVPVDNYNYHAHYEQYLADRELTTKNLSFIEFRDKLNKGYIEENRIYGTRYREKLLNARRKNIIEAYNEPNNYYRMLNGLPNIEVDEKYYYYLPTTIAESLGLSDEEVKEIQSIPVHKIQDYYNDLDKKNGIRGDLIMKMIEGTGFIDVMKNASRVHEYLVYGGTFDGVYAHINDNTRQALGIDQNVHSHTKIILMNNYSSSSFDDETDEGYFGYRANKDVYYVAIVTCSFAGLTINRGDWLVSDGEKWYLIDNSTNVDGKSVGFTPYLDYLGSNRIDIDDARRAKNFEILRLDKNIVRSNIYDAFIDIYEQCRSYVMGTIYQYNFKSFFRYYENFTAMCIMLMTELHMITKQIPFEVRRNFFDIYALRMLYEAYNFPYNINIDIDTQNLIVKNLNLIIQNKATNKVIYDIGHLLGFTNMSAYKYYLAKQHKMDPYGIPIFKTKTVFNNDTGEFETIPDYNAMYDFYFQKDELIEDDFIRSFRTKLNKLDYYNITTNDPFWWEDQNLIDRKTQSEYNFVETKYLSLGISYNMTDILFENMIMFKLLFEHSKNMTDVVLTLPKIVQGSALPLFDVIILLLCIVSKSHKLTGEIVSYPTDIISVIDYLNNCCCCSCKDRGEIDTFAFDFNYFLSEESTEDLAEAIRCVSKSKFNFRLSHSESDSPRYLVVNEYNPDIPDRQILWNDLLYNIEEEYFVGDYVTPQRNIKKETAYQIAVLMKQGFDIKTIAEILDTDCDETISPDVEKFMNYISILKVDSTATPEEKIATVNKMYSNIRGFYNYLNNRLRSENDHETYHALRTLYQAGFYSTEIRDIFAIKWRDTNGEQHSRTAKNFFEFLFYKNPILYSAVFEMRYDEEYDIYCRKKENGKAVTKYIYCDESDIAAIRVTQEMLDGSWHQGKNTYSSVKLTLPFARVGEYVKILSENPTYVQFCQYVDSGLIDIHFDKVKGLDNSDVNAELMSSTLYYYANHIIARIKTIINDVKYDYLLNGLSTLLQELLIRLVKFVKSYTVDFISLDEIVKYDFRFENLMKLMDVEQGVQKTIVPEDTLNLGFSDMVFPISNIEIGSNNYLNDLARRIYMNNPSDWNSALFAYRYGVNEYYELSAIRENNDFTCDGDCTPNSLVTPYPNYCRVRLSESGENLNTHVITDPDYSIPYAATYLEIAGPKIDTVDSTMEHLTRKMGGNNLGIKLMYGEDYLSNPSKYPGMRIIFDDYNKTSLSTAYTDHNMYPNSYIYTVYVVCRAIGIEDVLTNDQSDCPSVRFLTTPIIDIYTGAGIETIGIREYNTNPNTFDMNFVDGIITKEYARDWHVIAVSQNINNVKVYIDGRCALDKTFDKRTEFTRGEISDFNIRFMPNDMIGVNMKDVLNGYAYYACPVDYRWIAMSNKAHHSSELRENSKMIMMTRMNKNYED